MEAIFALPFAILAAFLAALALLLLCPKAISLPLCQLLSKLRRNTAAKSVFGTVCLLLSGILLSSCLDAVHGADRGRHGDLRGDLMGSIDYLRAQASCVLCLLNLMLLLLLPALAERTRLLDSQMKNLDAMKRQVKGLQTEYERVTAKPGEAGSAASAGEAEADEWKHKVDRLIREKNEMQAAVDAAVQGKSGAEAKVEAMLSQIKGFDKEYDRILDENKQLKRRLAQVDGSFQAGVSDKKGD